MTEKKNALWVVLAVVVLATVVFSACTSAFAAKEIHALRAEQSAKGETKEDGVTIMGQYTIRSTLPISDAYHSGNTSGLDSKEKETLDMASAVLEEIITDDMTPYEKERAVYDWMTSKLSYDAGVLQVIPNTTADSDNPYGTLKYHNAICVGYATTFRLFMQMLDIPCMVVHNGEAFHSWNLVQLDGAWYHVDIYSDQGTGSYANFNMNDDMAASGHDWDRNFFPAATSLDYHYGYQNRKTVEDVYALPQLLRQAMENGESSLFLGFPSLDETGAQVVETLLSTTQVALAEAAEFQTQTMQHTWLPVGGGEFVLSVTLEDAGQQGLSPEELTPETVEKVEQAVQKAFGVSVPVQSEAFPGETEVMG